MDTFQNRQLRAVDFTVLVSGLPPHWTSRDVRRSFDRIGEVVHVGISLDYRDLILALNKASAPALRRPAARPAHAFCAAPRRPFCPRRRFHPTPRPLASVLARAPAHVTHLRHIPYRPTSYSLPTYVILPTDLPTPRQWAQEKALHDDLEDACLHLANTMQQTYVTPKQAGPCGWRGG